MLLVNMSELSHVATLKVDHEYFRSVIHVCACHDQLITCLADNGCYVKVALRNLLHNGLLTRAAGVVDFEKLNGTVYRRCEVDFLSIIAPHVIRDGAVPCCGKVDATTGTVYNDILFVRLIAVAAHTKPGEHSGRRKGRSLIVAFHTLQIGRASGRERVD